MLVNEKLLLSSIKLAKEDQILILTGMAWSDFEQLITEEYLGYRASYKDGEITIVSPGRNHERIAKTIQILVVAYCLKYNKPYFPFGSTTLKNPPLAGKEPDAAFAFNTDKEIPDLAVEVIFSSGSITDLEKYKILEVEEVWLWKNNQLTFYQLLNNSYQIISDSNCLVNIKSAELASFINRGLTESPLLIEQDFTLRLPN